MEARQEAMVREEEVAMLNFSIYFYNNILPIVCLSDFHSGKFEDKTLDSFAGAVIGDNENDLGTDLQDYSHSMLEEKEAVPK